jgi:hypothetical protein
MRPFVQASVLTSARAIAAPRSCTPGARHGLWLALLLGACSADTAAPRGEPVLRDSAGVAIVEYPADLSPPTEWAITLDGAVRMASEFSRVRDGARLGDGRLVVADGDSRTLRYFGADGALQHTAGRAGAGPGEFRSITYMNRWLGDSVLVWDVQQRRLSVFDESGTFARSFALVTDSTTPFGNVHGVFGDGSMYASGFSAFPSGDGPQPGRQQATTPAYRFASDGRLATVYPFEQSGEGFFIVFDNGGFSVMTPLFARSTTLHAGRALLVHATNERYELLLRAPTGELQRIIRRAGTPPPVTAALRSAVVEHTLSQMENAAQRERERGPLETMDVPPTVPAFGRVLLDRADHVWVEEYDAIPRETTVWLVFATDGSLRARATMPQRLAPIEIGEDHVLGVERDALDVESVVLVSLVRSSSLR